MPQNVVQNNKIDGEMEKLNLQHISRLEIPITLTPNISTIDDIKLHMHHRQRLTLKHINRIWTHLENHMKKYRIDPTNPNYNQWLQYMDYLETIENTPPSMLKYIWNYWRKILNSYGIPNGKGTPWQYKPPSIPPSNPRTIPTPDQIYQLTHYNYNTDPNRKALCQYSLLHSIIFGWRNPSETCMLKTNDINFDEQKIIVTEKKKHNKKRIVITEYPQILYSPRCKSLKNWVDIWRPKLETQYSKDYLYIRATDGRPLNEMQYTNFITRMVKPQFPWFTMYCTRHFNATALLIKEYLNTGHWNKQKIKTRLGHENDNTTDVYIKYAEEYINKYRFDWFKRILKNHKINIKNKSMIEENSLKSTNPQKTLVSHGNPPYRSANSEQRYTTQQKKNKLIKPFKKLLSLFQPLTKKNFSFHTFFIKPSEGNSPFLSSFNMSSFRQKNTSEMRHGKKRRWFLLFVPSFSHMSCIYPSISPTHRLNKPCLITSHSNMFFMLLQKCNRFLGSLCCFLHINSFLNCNDYNLSQNCDSNTKKGCIILSTLFNRLYLKFTNRQQFC